MSEVLEAAGFPILAEAMQGKELRVVGASAEPPDPDLMMILSAKDLPDTTKAILIKWWRDRTAADNARRRADAESIIKMQEQRHSA